MPKATKTMQRTCTLRSSRPTAAAAAHHRGDDAAAVELSARAQEYSMDAAEKTEEIARRTPEH